MTVAKPLAIEKNPFGMGYDNIKITGFTDNELYELKSMEHGEAIEAVVDMLNRRNQGKGRELQCGYGIYGMWFDNEFVYMRVGDSCD